MDAPVSLDALITSVRTAAPDDPIAQLEEAARQRTELADLTDALLGHFVDQARRAGCSWTQIGEALGVSKQAAQQKHSSRSLPFERLTERTAQAIERAQDEARRLGHDYVGTEHLLLGLLAVPECLAARVLVERDITTASVEAHVLATVGRGEGTGGTVLPHTPRAVRVLTGALPTALSLGHNYIGTEHVLLSLYDEADGIAARFLVASGFTKDAARERIVTILLGLTGG